MIKYFGIKELVSRRVYNLRGEKAWQLLEPRALMTLEFLRKQFGSCVVNDWSWGGQYSQSGLRDWEFYMQDNTTQKVQAQVKISESMSQHKYGRAFDCKFANYPAEEVRTWLKENWAACGLPWAITLEDGVSWLHFDVRTQDDPIVYSFSP